MKMKEACRSTSLTERAIRIYLSKGLLVPRQVNGIIDFDDNDIRTLKDIATLRQRGFSIGQISDMLHDAAAISTMIDTRIDEARHAAAYEQETLDALRKVRSLQFHSTRDFVKQLDVQALPPMAPNFAQFDEIDEESLQLQMGVVAHELSKKERMRRRLRVYVACVGVLLAVGIAIGVFLASVRIDGYVPLSPCTVVEMRPRDPLTFYTERITLSMDGEWAREIVGQDVIALPAVVVRPVKEGQTLSNGVQLALKITNLDLIRMGISPLHSFRTQSEDVNSAWLKTIINAYFKQDDIESAKVWIGDIANKRPLFRR